MSKRGASRSVTGFELFRCKIEYIIDHRRNSTHKSHNMDNHDTSCGMTNRSNRPDYITSGGERVWSF